MFVNLMKSMENKGKSNEKKCEKGKRKNERKERGKIRERGKDNGKRGKVETSLKKKKFKKNFLK
jgi:hypothetical protein